MKLESIFTSIRATKKSDGVELHFNVHGGGMGTLFLSSDAVKNVANTAIRYGFVNGFNEHVEKDTAREILTQLFNDKKLNEIEIHFKK